MGEHITDQELERIEEFAKTPVYKREPEQLLPPGQQSPEASATQD